MRKLILATLGTMLFISEVLGQQTTFNWATVQSTNHIEAIALAVDNNENSYIGGYFAKAMDLDPGPGLITKTASGYADAFIVKLDKNGNYLWGHTFGGMENDIVSSLDVDENGSLYVTGYFRGAAVLDSLDFDFGPGEAFLKTSWDKPQLYVLKLDSSGNFQWVKGAGYSELTPQYSNEIKSSMIKVKKGQVYVTGTFSGSAMFNAGADTTVMASNGGTSDIILLKFDENGIFKWGFSEGSSIDRDYGEDLTIDDNQNVYLTGWYRKSVDFNTHTLTAQGTQEMFLQKVDSTGKRLWVKSIKGDGGSHYQRLASSSNELFILGNYDNITDLDFSNNVHNSGGTEGFFVQKADSSANPMWIKDFNGSFVANSIDNDSNGNSYVYGFFSGTVDFSTTGSPIQVTAEGTTDFFIMKLDPQGQLDFVSTIQSNGYVKSSTLRVKNKNIFAFGAFNNTIYLDTANNVSATAKGPYDGILTIHPQCVAKNYSIISEGSTLKSSVQGLGYRWLDCNNNKSVIQNETLYSYTPSMIGAYAVEINTNGCKDTTACEQFITVSTLPGNEDHTKEIKVFPSPTSDFIYWTPTTGNCQLFDNSGRIIIEVNASTSRMDLSGLPEGVYILIAGDSSFKIVKK